jgi:sulfur carrier protein
VITVRFNGEPLIAEAGSVDALLTAQSVEARGVAVAINGHVIPRSEWRSTSVDDGDVIEVVTAAAGG